MRTTTPLALGLLVAFGCGTSPAPETLVCTDFKAGADLTATDFGVSPGVAPTFLAFAQAASDVTTLAAASASDIGHACRSMAIAFGADAGEPVSSENDGPAKVSAWCDRAVTAFDAKAPALRAAHLAVRFTAP